MGWIYFAHNATAGLVKIGFSSNPRRRLASLSMASGTDLILVGLVGGATRRGEGRVHACLRSFRVKGEWFKDHDDVMSEARKGKDVLPPEGYEPKSLKKDRMISLAKRIEDLDRRVIELEKKLAQEIRDRDAVLLALKFEWSSPLQRKDLKDVVHAQSRSMEMLRGLPSGSIGIKQ